MPAHSLSYCWNIYSIRFRSARPSSGIWVASWNSTVNILKRCVNYQPIRGLFDQPSPWTRWEHTRWCLCRYLNNFLRHVEGSQTQAAAGYLLGCRTHHQPDLCNCLEICSLMTNRCHFWCLRSFFHGQNYVKAEKIWNRHRRHDSYRIHMNGKMTFWILLKKWLTDICSAYPVWCLNV